MSQRPIDQRSSLATRQTLWRIIRATAGEPFTAAEVRRQTRCSKSQVEEYIIRLVAGGVLQLLTERPCRGVANHYRLQRDPGIEPPRFRRDGSSVTQGRGNEQMWRTMRALGSFSAVDLAIAASTEDCAVAAATAAKYCQALCAAGYLRTLRPGRGTGKGGQTAQYGFIPARYSGPLPPMIQRVKQVYDPNTGQVVWSAEEASA